MSLLDFSERDVHNSVDRMHDINRDGKIDPMEQVNINRFYDETSKNYGHGSTYSGGCSSVILKVIGFIFVIAIISGIITSCVDYIDGADDRKESRDEARREKEFDEAQTVHYFYDDGTESDPENSLDDKYDIRYDRYYTWDYSYQDGETGD